MKNEMRRGKEAEVEDKDILKKTNISPFCCLYKGLSNAAVSRPCSSGSKPRPHESVEEAGVL
jgi:hypothetical protein